MSKQDPIAHKRRLDGLQAMRAVDAHIAQGKTASNVWIARQPRTDLSMSPLLAFVD